MKKTLLVFTLISIQLNAQTDNLHFINSGCIEISEAKAFVGEIFIVQNFQPQGKEVETKEDVKVIDTQSKILLQPNPTENVLTIIADNPLIYIEVYNNLGNLLLIEKNVLNNQINVERLIMGVYNIHIYLENQTSPSILTFIKL